MYVGATAEPTSQSAHCPVQTVKNQSKPSIQENVPVSRHRIRLGYQNSSFNMFNVLTGVSRCVAERKSAQEIARKPTSGIFIPECNPDGSYVDAQCHSGIGFCWCVTKLGRPLPGSSARLKKPDCTPYREYSYAVIS